MTEPAASRACDRWATVATTDSLDGSGGLIDHYSRQIHVPLGGPTDAAFSAQVERLMRYDIFPARVMRAEVCSADGRIHEGTTIVQHVAIGPFRLEAAVRVIRIWHNQVDEAEEIGFTYATLEGHPERGVSTFRIRRQPGLDNGTFLIDVRSTPGSLLTRLTRPLARGFQRRVTAAALTNFAGDGIALPRRQ